MFKVSKESHQPLMLSLVSAQVLNPELYFRGSPGCATVHAKADIIPWAHWFLACCSSVLADKTAIVIIITTLFLSSLLQAQLCRWD